MRRLMWLMMTAAGLAAHAQGPSASTWVHVSFVEVENNVTALENHQARRSAARKQAAASKRPAIFNGLQGYSFPRLTGGSL